MHIAIVAPPWLPVPPPAYGGTEAVVDGLCRGLAVHGHDVLLCAAGPSACPVEIVRTVDDAPGTGDMSPQAAMRHVIRAYAAIEEWRADLVHDHTILGPLYAHGESSRPVVTTFHGPVAGDLEDLYRVVAHRVPAIAISHDQVAHAHNIPIAAVIHHGIDVDQFPVGDGDGGYALFLGRMTPEKGVTQAIEAAREASVPLRIAAKMDGAAERRFFHDHVEPLLGDGIDYVGEVGGEDKLALLRDATCLLNPIAWREPFGMVMIESLACGTPVVVTPVGAAPEIVTDGETGFLAADRGAVVAALRRVHELDRRACRKAAETKFSVERMAADHLALYERLLSGVQ